MRRPAVVAVAVLAAMGVWLGFVLAATRDNVNLDYAGIYDALGSSGDPADCPDVTKPPDSQTISAAQNLHRAAVRTPLKQVPNTDPSLGTVNARNAQSIAADALAACVDDSKHPAAGWRPLVALLQS
ncbi:MAG: hypothetical protein U0Y82_04785 [Thermoleophilia bacterium]